MKGIKFRRNFSLFHDIVVDNRLNFRRIIACALMFFSHEHVLVEKTKKICRNLWLLTRQPIKSSAIRTGSTRYCYCNNAFRSHKEVNNSHACVVEFDTAHVVRPFSIDTLRLQYTLHLVIGDPCFERFQGRCGRFGRIYKGCYKGGD